MKQKIVSSQVEEILETTDVRSDVSRRHFLQLAGGIAGAGILLAACKKSNNDNTGKAPAGSTISVGSGDTGVLNYAYVLEQLEASFYERVVLSPYANISPSELRLLTDIKDHEVAHREFYKTVLGSSAVAGINTDFSSINFSDRTSVLTAARAFEDLGVSAYNGAGRLLQSSTYLLLAGKIASVESRHAAYLHDAISNGTFADGSVVDSNGLDLSRTPAQVVAAASVYINNKIDVSNLPNI